MGAVTIPCLVVLATYSFVLLQPNLITTIAHPHIIDQNKSNPSLDESNPPTTPASGPLVQQPEVRAQRASDLPVQPLQATDVLNSNPQPCGFDSGRQAPQYWPLGPPGPVGAPGPAGSAGIPGLPGGQGAQGARGERGDRGELGLPGYAGVKGDKGDLGPVGPAGLVGLEGLNGTKGDKGEPGRNYTPPAMSAFHVGRSSHLQLTSGSQIISFNTIYTNIGNDMSNHTGVFTCRIPGLYFFTYTFYAYSSGSYGMHVQLLVNNEVKSEMFMTPMAKYLMQSQTAILSLAKNDDVWLKAVANTYIYGEADRNVFSGYLINAS